MLAFREVGAGPPVVLLHPVGTDGSIWWQHMPRLAQRFRVLAVDLPGHGCSPVGEGPLTLERMANELYRLLLDRCCLPAHLVGLSIGAMVAMVLAVDNPEAVASLTLCDTPYEMNPALAEVLEGRAKAVETGGMASLVPNTLERWFAPNFATTHPDVVATVERLLYAADPAVNAQGWRAIAGLGVAHRLPALRIPALVVHGELDNSIPPGAAQGLAGLLGARRVELSGCAHLAPIEAPDTFMNTLEPFLLGGADGGSATANPMHQ